MNHLGQVAIPTLVIAFVMYRRIRRSIGFQRFRAGRLQFRVGLLALVGVLLLATGYAHPIRYLADAGGILCGAVLAYYAIRHSEFERREDGLYYRTHTGIQMLVVALLIIRVVYRIAFVQTEMPAAGDPANANDPMRMWAGDPWTAAVFFVMLAYYAGYYTFLLRQGKRERLDANAAGRPGPDSPE